MTKGQPREARAGMGKHRWNDEGLFKLRAAPNSLGVELGGVQDFLRAGPTSWQCGLCRHTQSPTFRRVLCLVDLLPPL